MAQATVLVSIRACLVAVRAPVPLSLRLCHHRYLCCFCRVVAVVVFVFVVSTPAIVADIPITAVLQFISTTNQFRGTVDTVCPPYIIPVQSFHLKTINQGTSGAEVRVATERSLGKDALGKDSGERIVYVKGNKAQRESALDMIRSNPKVGRCGALEGVQDQGVLARRFTAQDASCDSSTRMISWLSSLSGIFRTTDSLLGGAVIWEYPYPQLRTREQIFFLTCVARVTAIHVGFMNIGGQFLPTLLRSFLYAR